MNVSTKCLGALGLAALLAACSGSNGPQGPQGDQGDPGDSGTPAGVAAGSKLVVSNETAAVVGANVELGFNLKVGGVNRDDATKGNNAYTWYYPDPQTVTTVGGVRTTVADWTLTSKGNGDYTVALNGVGPTALGKKFLAYVNVPGSGTAYVVVKLEDATHKVRELYSEQACQNCHGNYPIHANRPANSCTVCHNLNTQFEARLASTTTPTPAAYGTRLLGYVHGIHNSGNMTATNGYTMAEHASAFTDFKIGFPGYMQDCSTCHDTPETLQAVTSAPFSYKLCISCHDGWAGFYPGNSGTFGGTDHSGFGPTRTCDGCHSGTDMPKTLADAHNKNPYDLHHGEWPNSHYELFWNGTNQSLAAGQAIKLAIASVTKSGTNLVVRWTAGTEADPDAYNPCNTNPAAGPMFIFSNFNSGAYGTVGEGATVSHNMAFLRGYAQANDWVTGLGSSTAPGQPVSTSLSNSNTSCGVDPVAVTTISAPELASMPTSITKGVVGLQGKPFVYYAPANTFMFVRSKSPVREFNVSNGALPSSSNLRRQIVSSEKCLACHKGTMYQHGGNRVDNTDLCVLCHNPASSEGHTRQAWGIDAATEAWDGKAGQTFDLRVMLHKIHSAGESGSPLVYYRSSNGVYVFGNQKVVDGFVANGWKSTAITCTVGGEPTTTWLVRGSENASAWGSVNVPVNAGSVTLDPADACSSTPVANLPAGYTKGVYKNHTEILVHYPRPLTDCDACHVNGSEKKLPDPTKAVAITWNSPGASPWTNQADDELMAPVAGTCLSCHEGDPWVVSHVASGDFGAFPTLSTAGRQAFIDGDAGDACAKCHGAGRFLDLANSHMP